MIWTPRTTVAAIIEQNGQFLMVEEQIDDSMKLNQPAGHLESGESLIDAVIRETREETACTFAPQALIGIYRWQNPDTKNTYLRFAFCGAVTQYDASQPLDADIHQTLWLTLEQIQNRQADLRSPLVMGCLQDYLAGKYYSVDILKN